MPGVMDGLPSEIASRYQLRSELGRGGMALVYLAEDRQTGREVAVKVLRPELAASIGASRFLREIHFLATLHHPNILPILDSDEAGTYLYYVMPYVRGETLRARIDREGPLPVATAIRVASELASAIDYAHTRNIIHRDIKPENVLFDGERAMICDFGVARALVVSNDDGLSSSGLAVGTPSYMSPEQALEARDIDGRTDIYALGCVTYEMLSGERPFTGPTAQAIISRHLSQSPRSIRVVRPEIPAHVEQAVIAALAKRAADRPRNGADFVRRLEGR